MFICLYIWLFVPIPEFIFRVLENKWFEALRVCLMCFIDKSIPQQTKQKTNKKNQTWQNSNSCCDYLGFCLFISLQPCVIIQKTNSIQQRNNKTKTLTFPTLEMSSDLFKQQVTKWRRSSFCRKEWNGWKTFILWHNEYASTIISRISVFEVMTCIENIFCLLVSFNHHGAPAVFWICSLRMRMLCRCSGGNMAICSGVSCRTCMISSAWKKKHPLLFSYPSLW